METYDIVQSNIKGFWNILNEAGQMVCPGIKGKIKAKRIVKELQAPEKEEQQRRLANLSL